MAQSDKPLERFNRLLKAMVQGEPPKRKDTAKHSEQEVAKETKER